MLIPGSLAMRRAIVIALCCLAAVYLGLNIPDEPFMAFMILGLAAYLVTLPLNSSWLGWLVVATAHSAIIMPALPGRPFLWEACSLAAWPSLVAFFALNRRSLAEIRIDREARRAMICLGIYLGVLVILMLVRGVGFRAFGGEQMGGRFYVQQVILAILPLLLLVVNWRERTILAAFYTGVALTGTYLVSDFVFAYGGKSTEFLLSFLELPTDAVNFYVGQELTGLRRFQSFAMVGGACFMALLSLVPLRQIFGSKFFWAFPCLLATLGVGLASGHRTILVHAIGTLIILGFIQRLYTPIRLVALMLALAVGGVVLFNYAKDLPMGVQRSISLIPGIEVDPLAAADAAATVTDRVEVLKLAVKLVPRYLWVGRGFGLDRLDLRAAGAADDRIVTLYENGYFENGALGLLLKTGAAGLLAALGYLWFISRAARECLALIAARPAAEHDTFDLYCQLMAAQWFTIVPFFLFLRGDASTFMQTFALASAVMLFCLKAQRARAAT